MPRYPRCCSHETSEVAGHLRLATFPTDAATGKFGKNFSRGPIRKTCCPGSVCHSGTSEERCFRQVPHETVDAAAMRSFGKTTEIVFIAASLAVCGAASFYNWQATPGEPPKSPCTWPNHSGLVRSEHCSKLRDAALVYDADAGECGLSGVTTSGTCILYADEGRELFCRGLNSVRGHRGPSPGATAFRESLLMSRRFQDSFPVFGCALTPIQISRENSDPALSQQHRIQVQL